MTDILFIPAENVFDRLQTMSLYEFLCQPSRARYLLVSSGIRPSYMMAK